MRFRIIPFLLGSCLALTTLAADKPVDVRDIMTASEFHATGLDTLKPDQLAAFNAWLATYAQGSPQAAAPLVAMPAAPVAAALPGTAAVPTAAPAASSANSFGKEMVSAETRGEPARIESRITGTFTGWRGNTVFKLDNGQVWVQADSSSYDTRLENPPVVIKRLGFGYLLSLTGHGATVFVKRVQ